MQMTTLPETDAEILPPNPIRVETALSRYPVHRLAKRGDIAIDIREEDEDGDVLIKWEVNYIPKFGQPGPLAYKLDTLIINRRIEEARRPIPKIIRLGSLRDITEELGLSTHNDNVRRSLHQNSSAYITAKIKYKIADGGERNLETGFNRYSVVLTGERLPDGREADAVYIVLNDIYMQVLNGAMTRPLDYDYLKGLPPAPQRFYELLSYQMYAAIKNDRSRAKLVYSEFCIHAPQTRHFEWLRVRTQMNKVHAKHKVSGYIADIAYEQTVDAAGRPDWLMLYQPGPKARAEFRAFTRRGGPVMLEVEPFTADLPPQLAAPEPPPLGAALIGRGVTAGMAAGLVREHGEEKVRAQLEHLDWLVEKKPGKVDDPAAWLVSAIRNGHAAPKGFVSKAERQAREEAKRAKERAKDEQRRRDAADAARDRTERERAEAEIKRLAPTECAALEAEALAGASPEERELYDNPPTRTIRETTLRRLLRQHVIERLRDREGMVANNDYGAS